MKKEPQTQKKRTVGVERGGAISSVGRAAWGGVRPLSTHLLVRGTSHWRAIQPCNALNPEP